MTTERYDEAAARHYAAFRPPLHRPILQRLIPNGVRYRSGLDIGCGTGRSSVALADHCDQVTGLDPSPSMLEQAQPHPRVSYVAGGGDSLDRLPAASAAVVTFAGSLFYAKTSQLRAGLLRVGQPDVRVLVYDFEVLVEEACAVLEIGGPPPSGYDHRINLSDWSEWTPDSEGHDRLALEVQPTQLAHLMLSDSFRYDALRGRFPTGDLLEKVTEAFRRAGRPSRLLAEIHFAGYGRK